LKSSLVEGVTLSANVRSSDGKERQLPTTAGVRKLEWVPFRVVSKTPQCLALPRYVINIHQRYRQMA